MKIFLLILLAGISGVLYRIGGKGGFPKAKLIRRAGVPLLCYYPALFVLFGPNAWLWGIISAGLLALALTTYHDYLAPDKVTETWLCWLMTGFCYGLVALPLIWTGVHWYAIIGRSITLAGLTMWVSQRSGKVLTEEIWRGALLILTLPILKI